MTNNTKNIQTDNDLFFSTFRKSVDYKSNSDNGWKSAVRNEWQFYDLIQKAWERPFHNYLEKHIAIQASSILLGDTEYLSRWPLKPWRTIHDVDYDLSNDRSLPKGQNYG